MSSIDLTPRGLLNGDNNYVLQDEGLYGLLKYIWAGLLLPKTTWEYSDRLRLPEETYANIEPVLAPLIEAYNTANGHCETFKSTTYPSITGTADDIFSYAQTAAGNGPEPYFAYGYLVETLRQLASTESPSEQETLKKDIGNILNFHLRFIDNIITKSQAAVNNLRAFEQATMTDREAIMLCQNAVVKKLDMDVASLAALQNDLGNYRRSLQVDIYEYEKDLIKASLTPSWFGMIFYGLMPTGFYRRMTNKLGAAIRYFAGLIEDTEGQLSEERSIVAALAATESDLTSLLGAMSPAISTVEAMMGAWQAIAGDLTSISRAVQEDSRAVDTFIEGIIGEKIAEKWATLAAAVDRFRQASNIADVQMQSLDRMENDIQGTVI
ncbi:hypothetical protein GGG16DRAFT_116671 [Schizophyllum commune]